MPRQNEYSLDLRQRIVNDRNIGLSYRQLAQKYNLSFTGARKICLKNEEFGTVKNLSGRGRKRKTSERDDTQIVREVKKNPKLTSREIKEVTNLSVSTRTICRRLREKGKISCIQRKKPFISKANIKKRLKFAKQYRNKGSDFWNNVLWSDESKFQLFGSKKRDRVWRNPGTAYAAQNIKATIKHGGGSVMVWGCFAGSGVGNLCLIENIMTAGVYVDILKDNLKDSVRKIGLPRRFIFQQDNDPKHTSKLATQYFIKNKIKLLEWPPQSPDLNPIENLWMILDEKLPFTERSNKNDFFRHLRHVWNQISTETTSKLIESMPRRLEAVITSGGGHTKY